MPVRRPSDDLQPFLKLFGLSGLAISRGMPGLPRRDRASGAKPQISVRIEQAAAGSLPLYPLRRCRLASSQELARPPVRAEGLTT
jgi:hypothetical protein